MVTKKLAKGGIQRQSGEIQTEAVRRDPNTELILLPGASYLASNINH